MQKKMKLKGNYKNPKKLSYKEGAKIIQSYVENLVGNCLNILNETECASYLESQEYRKNNNRVSTIIDNEGVAIMTSIVNSGVVKNPFEYLLWGVMERTSPLVKGKDKEFYRLNAIACRLIDSHFYYSNGKSNEDYRKELIRRGWYGQQRRKELANQESW